MRTLSQFFGKFSVVTKRLVNVLFFVQSLPTRPALGEHPRPGLLPGRGKRGATALMFAVSAAAFLTFVGLGTQTGAWYLSKRTSQNAADGAALAGALAVFWANYPQACDTSAANPAVAVAAQSSATDIATRNGLTGADYTITASSPPGAGAYATDNCAVRTQISQTQPPLLAALAGRTDNIVITASATARLTALGPVCALSLADNLVLGSTGTTTGSSCILASNAKDTAAAINVLSGAIVAARTLYSDGGCNNCSSAGVSLTSTKMVSQVMPVTTSYAAMDAVPLPTFAGLTCAAATLSGTTTQLFPTYAPTGYTNGTGKAFCNSPAGDLVVGAGKTVRLAPGTYFFQNATINVNGGTLVCWDPVSNAACANPQGVTIIFSSSTCPCGPITIQGGGTVTLRAPAVNSWNAAANGLLFYQSSQVSNTGPALITGSGTTTTATLVGGMYFPVADVTINGTSTTVTSSTDNCLTLTAKGITTGGSANVTFSNSGCSAATSTTVAQVVTAKIWE